MRIQELALKAFGPFTDFNLDLSAAPGAVNVLFGANEAGKSSALRGLEGFCFGFPKESPDNHVHGYDQMRVGATLCMADGTTREFQRRKGNKNTLLNGQGIAIPDQDFTPFLCGVERPGFEALFCLSYQRLSEASEGILAEEGELGKLLFEARSDLNLRAILKQLESRSSALYKGTSKANSVIDNGLRTFDDIRKSLRKGDIGAYEDIAVSQRGLQKEIAALKGEQQGFRTAQQRLARQKESLPLVRKLLRNQAAIHELGPVPELPPSFAENYGKVCQQLLNAETRLAEHRKQLIQTEEKLAQISEDDGILMWQSDIERLNKQVAQINGFLEDIPKQEGLANEAMIKASSELGRVRPGETPELSSLNIDFAAKRIRDLRQKGASLTQQLEVATTDYARIDARIKDAKRKLQETQAIQHPASLSEAVLKARSLNDPEGRLEKMVDNASKLRIEIEQEASRLGAGSRKASEFAAARVPLRDAVKSFEETWKQAEDDVIRITQRLQDAEDTLHSSRVEKLAFTSTHDVPSLVDLVEARDKRTSSWTTLKSYIANPTNLVVANGQALEFEAELQTTDHLADRLRLEADDSARLDSIESEILKSQADVDRLSGLLSKSIAKSEGIKTEWLQSWAESGIAPDEPRKMSDWLSRFEKLGRLATDLQELDGQIASNLSLISSARANLAEALNKPTSDLSLSQLLAEGEKFETESRTAAGTATMLNRQIEGDIDELEEASKKITNTQAQLAIWSDDWKAETASLNLPRTPNPEEAEYALDAIAMASKHLRDSEAARGRVQGMKTDLNAFNDAAAKLTESVGVDIPGLPPVSAVEYLYTALRKASKASIVREALVRQQVDQQDSLRKSQNDLTAFQNGLQEMCRIAECQNREELGAIVVRSQHVGSLQAQIEETSAELEARTAGQPLGAFCEEVCLLDEDTVTGQLEQTESDIQDLVAKIEEKQRELGKQEGDLSHLDTSLTQLENQITAEAALARVRSAVRPYFVYSLAESLIKAQIEEYRLANQGPILGKAGEIFSVLTDGSFSSLTADVDEKDKPVLVAVRKSRSGGTEQRLGVSALSSATRIALYLSLRLACLHHHCDQKEGLPFVADDILLDFDDGRARRVMEELGRLAHRTQVILFTHHKHLVDIAQEVLGERCLVSNLAR